MEEEYEKLVENVIDEHLKENNKKKSFLKTIVKIKNAVKKNRQS